MWWQKCDWFKKKNPYPSVITVKIRASRTAAHCHITVEEECSVAVTTESLYTVLYAIYFLSLLPWSDDGLGKHCHQILFCFVFCLFVGWMQGSTPFHGMAQGMTLRDSPAQIWKCSRESGFKFKEGLSGFSCQPENHSGTSHNWCREHLKKVSETMH